MSGDSYFTLVFEGDIRSFKPNPFKTETSFGVPVAAGVGNAFKMLDTFDDLLALVKRYRAETPLGNQPSMIAEEADRIIAKAEGLAP